MEKYLNAGIKELIAEFPKIADILNGYNIGCVPCNVGTCLLKDIVEIHNLSIQQEEELIKIIPDFSRLRSRQEKSATSLPAKQASEWRYKLVT